MIVVVVRATEDARIAEALRAGLGLTLRGDHVTVYARAPLPVAAARAAATLQSFGHDVHLDASADELARAVREAHAVEVWDEPRRRGAGPTPKAEPSEPREARREDPGWPHAGAAGNVKRMLHIVRRGVAEAVADHDWVVYAEGDAWRLDPHGAPPLPPGPIDADQLHDLVFVADAVVTW